MPDEIAQLNAIVCSLRDRQKSGTLGDETTASFLELFSLMTSALSSLAQRAAPAIPLEDALAVNRESLVAIKNWLELTLAGATTGDVSTARSSAFSALLRINTILRA